MRRIAWKKIEDPERLETFARDERDDTLKKSALDRAQERWLQRALSGDEETAAPALAHLLTTRDLLEVVKRSPSEGLAQKALLAITEERALKDLAISDNRRTIALAAISRLNDSASLEAVAKNGKTKAIRAAAEAKLPKKAVAAAKTQLPKPIEISQEKKNRARQLQLCRNLETLVQEKNLERAKTERDQARTEWLELSWVAADAELDARFERVCTTIEKLTTEPAKIAEPAKTEAPKPAVVAPVVSEAPVAAAPAVVEESAEVKEAREAQKRALQERREADRIRREEDAAHLKQRIDETSEGLERAASDEQLTLKRALETLDTARAALASDEVKSAPADAKTRLLAVRDQLAGRINELREADRWKRWANVPMLEKLVARAEALAAIWRRRRR